MDNEPDSPCNGICTLNKKSVCEGCFRTIHEVVRWGYASDKEKEGIMTRAEERAKASGKSLALVG